MADFNNKDADALAKRYAEGRLPIYARRFHGHVRASRTLKPLNQLEETLSCRRKTTDLSRDLAFFDKSQAGHYLHLVYVQSRAPPK